MCIYIATSSTSGDPLPIDSPTTLRTRRTWFPIHLSLEELLAMPEKSSTLPQWTFQQPSISLPSPSSPHSEFSLAVLSYTIPIPNSVPLPILISPVFFLIHTFHTTWQLLSLSVIATSHTAFFSLSRTPSSQHHWNVQVTPLHFPPHLDAIEDVYRNSLHVRRGENNILNARGWWIVKYLAIFELELSALGIHRPLDH